MIDFKIIKKYLKERYGLSPTKILDQEDTYSFLVNQQSFLFVEVARHFLRLSLRVDYQLGKYLKESYEEVYDAHKLNPKKWLSLTATGQLTQAEIMALIDRSYAIVLQETSPARVDY